MDAVRDFMQQANAALEGSPYSVDKDERSLDRLAVIVTKVSQTQRSLAGLPENDALPQDLRKILRTREVFESNAIEGAGLSLAATSSVLEQYPVGRVPTEDFVKWAVEKAIREDRKVYDVIGLEAARRLAGDFARDFGRPLSESDLRSLHRVIMGDEPSAGQYKRFVNSIAGSSHETPLPIDTPDHMRQLSTWMTSLPTRGYRTIGSVIRAAAAHAWLAHIHPFEDGNGRLARLVANIMLSREGMPPLILRNKGDRAKYIDALSVSDEAGDISRLILVVSSALERVAGQMADPAAARFLFEQDVDVRRQGVFPYWEAAHRDWSFAVQAEHRLFGLDVNVVGGLTPSDFTTLAHRNPVSRAWFMETLRSGAPKGMWFFGYPSDRLWRLLEKDQMYPVLFYSVRHPDLRAARPYFVPNQDPRGVYRAFMLEPNERHVYALDGHGVVSRLNVDVAAREMAATAHSFAEDAPEPPSI